MSLHRIQANETPIFRAKERKATGKMRLITSRHQSILSNSIHVQDTPPGPSRRDANSLRSDWSGNLQSKGGKPCRELWDRRFSRSSVHLPALYLFAVAVRWPGLQLPSPLNFL